MRGIKIFIIGFSGTGKTTASGVLESLGLKVSYLDKEITAAAGKSIPEIFETEGEKLFRNRETRALLDFSEREDMDVADCGGGIITKAGNVDIMKKTGKIVLLDASPQIIFDRVRGDNGRPLLKQIDDADGIAAMKSGREPLYRAAADYVINTDKLTAEETAGEIYKIYEGCNRTGQSQI